MEEDEEPHWHDAPALDTYSHLPGVTIHTGHEQPLRDGEYIFPTPSVTIVYETIQEKIDAINKFAEEHGYAVVKRGTTCGGKYHDGPITRVYLMCDKGGAYRSSVQNEERQREANTKRSECPFRLQLRPSGGWELFVENDRHNYPKTEISTHPVLRRAIMSTFEERIDAHIRAGVNTRTIMTNFRNEGLAQDLKAKDITNRRQHLITMFLQGRTPIQALLIALPDEGKWIFTYRSEDDIITALFCIYKSSLEMLRSNPYVVIMDCTYKTNKYKMPMLDIIGVNALNKSFFIGFCFLSKEDETHYSFALQKLKEVYNYLRLPDPLTFICDKERALLNAMTAIFPNTKQMLCIWHINKALIKNVRPLIAWHIVSSTAYESDNGYKMKIKEVMGTFTTLWFTMTQVNTIKEFNERWAKLKQFIIIIIHYSLMQS